MRIEPELEEVIYGERGMLKAIYFCLENQCLVSAITLIFAAIDALSALTRPKDKKKTTREYFISWVDRYIKPEETLNCTSIDLYSARCGVLHTHMPESNLTMKGKARPIIYEWHSGPAADSSIPLPEGALVIQIEVLHKAFEEAVYQFIVDSEVEDDIKSCVQYHLKGLLCYRPWPQIVAHAAA